MRFDGKAFAQKILTRVNERAAAWKDSHDQTPITLHSIFPYQDPASVIYTQLKQKDARANGLEYQTESLSLQDTARVWASAVQAANEDKAIQGVLVQKPTSQKFQEVTGGTQRDFDAWWSRVSETISPKKDVDGLGPAQLSDLEQWGQLVQSQRRAALDSLDTMILPATALATILILLEMAGDVATLRQKRVAVIGRSQIVGRPAVAGLHILGVEAELMSSQSDLLTLLPEFDAIISATGKPSLVQPEMIAAGSWLIDVGAPTPEFAFGCDQKAQWWTPVPGGVGPVTRACLLENAVRLAE